jgi:hypothetical protein
VGKTGGKPTVRRKGNTPPTPSKPRKTAITTRARAPVRAEGNGRVDARGHRLSARHVAIHERIEALLIANPFTSDRRIARKVSTPPTIRKVRARLEREGRIPATVVDGHRRVLAEERTAA